MENGIEYAGKDVWSCHFPRKEADLKEHKMKGFCLFVLNCVCDAFGLQDGHGWDTSGYMAHDSHIQTRYFVIY